MLDLSRILLVSLFIFFKANFFKHYKGYSRILGKMKADCFVFRRFPSQFRIEALTTVLVTCVTAGLVSMEIYRHVNYL